MTWLFWGAAAIIAYAYAGYPLWLWVRCRWHPRPPRRGSWMRLVSIVAVVRNESEFIERKLRNLLEINYPVELFEIVIVSDGSTDATNDILAKYAKSPRLRTLVSSEGRGKAAGLNDAMQAARGEIVVFTDARQLIEPDAVRLLLENFADPAVGCASGELMLGDPNSGEAARGLGLYWRIEKQIREMESKGGSVVGATGAFYAVRRHLFEPVPPGTILDDVYIPMNVVRTGARVVLDSRARVWDVPYLGTGHEFARKVRTLSGNYQLLQLAPWILTRTNPIRFEFLSHKLVRLAVPFGLAAMLFSSVILQQPVYRAAFVLQLAFYGLSLLAVAGLKRGLVARAADVAFTFVVLNTAALVAFANFITGRKPGWSR